MPFSALVEEIEDVYQIDTETKALARHLQQQVHEAMQLGKKIDFVSFMKLIGEITFSELADQIGQILDNKPAEKQAILEMAQVKERLKLVANGLSKEMEVLRIENEVVNKTHSKMNKSMRQNVLRERLQTIKKELGEMDDDEEAVDEYQKKLKRLKVSPEIKNKVSKEIKKLEQMSAYNPEAGYIRSWLDTFFDLPWGKYAAGNFDLAKASKTLEKNHFALQDVKDRILEFIAVMQLKAQSSLPTILCFVGPPGVGKTSIGRSIAEALGRKFAKISLGGIRDEAEIRGHRRTYVGAMPGRIISGIKNAGSMNPVFMLDEIDKLGQDYKGDPSAALLEALDPEQNFSFEDHYLDMPFDLSKVLFITTANTLDTIPVALRDRLEIISFSGYTTEEKQEIAERHLLSKVLKNNGLKKSLVNLNKDSVSKIITRYTREAGVRDLERNLNAILRKIAKKIVEKKSTHKQNIKPAQIREYLGPEKFDESQTEKTDQVALATGLAWTSVGGDMLFIEVALTPGKGLVKLTGKLGEVMKESAQAALTYVKANAKKLGIKDKKLSSFDVHIHVPEGAVPKDGPSAGVTMTTAIVSAFTKRKIRKDVAMTGEVTLRGRVLRIGGLKEKAIAAYRGGAKMVIIPQENERDLEKMPDSIKKNLQFKTVTSVDEVLKIALL